MPALAQQAPQPAEPDLGHNYKGQPFVYDLLGRLKPVPMRIVDPEQQKLLKPCEAAMMKELRRSGLAENGKAVYRARLADRFKWVDGQLAGKNYLMGQDFSVADAYLFVVAGWGKHVGVDISGLANLGAFMARVGARPAVQEALKAEGLLK